MVDSIGLGSALANIIFIIIFTMGIFGVVFFLKKRNVLGAIFWASLILNLYFYAFFMGKYSFYPKMYFIAINKYWPLINIALFVWVVVSFIKNKQKKNIQ